MTAAALGVAIDGLLVVAGAVRTDDLDRPTPCTGWDVRRLLEHLVGWQRVFAACARDVAPPFDGGSPTYRAGDDPVADLRASTRELTDALGDRDDTAVDLPYRGRTPMTAHLEELVAETVLHTWDLATALGAPLPDTGPDVLAVAHRGLTSLLAQPFAPVAFAAPVVTEPADVTDLIIRSGRSE